MIKPDEIKQKAERLYPAFLSAEIKGEPFFPKEFSVGKLSNDWLILRNEVTQLIESSKQSSSYGYTVELETRKTRKHGNQSLPIRIIIDTEADYLKLINREEEFAKFKTAIELIRLEVPALESWLDQNPLKVAEYTDRWASLLKVCQYFQVNPNPSLYIRELPIKVHTKFIEEHKGILRSLLEAILPAGSTQSVESILEKDSTFEKRFSLRYKEALVRLRILDDTLGVKYGFPVSDLSTPISEFRQLNLERHNFIITENLMNFLTLPTLADSFALFVGGYAIQVLKTVDWLTYCQLFYWGDLDVDGFKILSQFRAYFPHTISVMMDEETFRLFEEFVVSVAESSMEKLPYLTPKEYCLFTYLSKQKKRLEQERISQDFANRYLQKVLQQDA